MATAAVQSVEQTTESLKKLTVDPQAKLAEASDAKNQPLSTQSVDVEISDRTPGAVGLVSSAEGSSGPGAQDTAVETNMFYGQNSYPPPTYYYEGYDSPAPEWEEYPRYVNIDGMEIPSPGVYSENGSVLYHAGYAYAPQVAYGPYSPSGTPFPSIRADSQLYGTRQLYTGPFYQQAVPPGVQYISSATPMSQAELSTSVGAEQSTFHDGDGSSANFVNENGMSMPPPRPGYSVAYGSVGRGVLHVTNTSPRYQDPRLAYDGIRPSGSWFDSKNDSERQQRSTSTSVPAVICQQAQALGPFGQNIHRASHVMGVQKPRPLSGIATAPTFNRVYSPNKIYRHSNNSGRLSPSYGTNGRTWVAVDKSKPRGRRNDSFCDCIGTIDVFSEQNRGPRTRFRNQPTSLGDALQVEEQILISNGNNEAYNVTVDREQYNSPEFVTKYKDAKFFIIKSYSEDNIHKSIKYGVWASTPNGNKKLDAAYREAQEKPGLCPIFLFFSVNASGQFCGVAEMTGPIDFQRNVDYWQQDKWSGQFPVKWHIIKDVSNSQFRHIILENNDNKPMTNSRDTQEVAFEQGVEVLTIFKNYICKMSILDDFQFYEARQKAIQERKTKQQESYMSGSELLQNKFLKPKDGNAGEDGDGRIKSGQTSADLTSTVSPLSGVLSGEGILNNQNSEGRVPSSSGDALKGGKPTTNKGNANQDGPGNE